MFHTLDLILCWCLYWPYRHYRLQDMFPTLPIAGYFQAWTFLTWLSVALFPGLFKNLEKRDTYSLIVHELNYFTIVTWNYASQATIDPWRTSLLSEKPQNSFHSTDSPQSTCHLRMYWLLVSANVWWCKSDYQNISKNPYQCNSSQPASNDNQIPLYEH